ncbi:MAG: sporulation protein YqfD, partial [Firmicutes bacterium]|nr:sporulation protein YqfD [Bacillota bacterium]
MLILHLWYYLTGYVRVRVTGTALEKFVNLCISRGIYLWGIDRDGQGILISMGAGNFRLLRPLARSTQSRVRILQKRGLPFYCLRLRRRQMLVVGLLLFFTALYGLGSFIWSIEVAGVAEPGQTKDILAEVHGMGVKVGVLKRNIDLDELSRQITLKNPDLAWVNVELLGTLLVINVVPKQTQSLVGMPCHMVARRAGLIEEIIVLMGEPLISVGQVVEKGDVLIRGVLADRPVAAQGIVRALIWPRAYG